MSNISVFTVYIGFNILFSVVQVDGIQHMFGTSTSESIALWFASGMVPFSGIITTIAGFISYA